tara:strand:+ start:1263 stop:1979 length:717 start_codon:yes stop_codon:yes gene_type:complete
LRSYIVKDKEHFVYDLESELPEEIRPIKNWRDGCDGDWVHTDDDAYIQVLKRKKIGKTDVVQTCIGTYSVTGKMDTAERKNRQSLNGKSSYDTLMNRKNPTGKEKLFAHRMVLGQDAVDAYMDVYDANSREYAKKRAALLLKTQRIDVLMDKNKEDVMGKLKIDLYYLLEKAKEEVDNGKNGSDRINALKMLWDAWGVVEKQKMTEITGIFQGFEQNKLEEVKRPGLPEYSSHGEDTL